MKEVFVYILRSLQDGKRYIGIAGDIERRLSEHNSGKIRSTKSRRPFKIIYTEKYTSRTEARSREKYYKTASGRRYLDAIESRRP